MDGNRELVEIEGDESVTDLERMALACGIHDRNRASLDHREHRLVVGQNTHLAFGGGDGDGLRRAVPHRVIGGDDVDLHQGL